MFFREKVILINALLLGRVTMATEIVSKLTKREKCRMLRGEDGVLLATDKSAVQSSKTKWFLKQSRTRGKGRREHKNEETMPGRNQC